MATFDQWLLKLTKLRVDRARGDAAPHKPLLALILFDLAEANKLPVSVLPLSPDLAFRFLVYWRVVAHRRRQAPDIRLPFHHLKSDGFWSPLTADGESSVDVSLTTYAKMPADLVAFLSDPASRERGRRLLIARYFEPNERIALYAAVGLPVPPDDIIKADAAFRPVEAAEQGREARFRVQVVSAYAYTCALTGYRLTTVKAGSIVDAAHIHQFSDSRNNAIDNGLALSKNAHWLFDQGLWTVGHDLRVIVAHGAFAEDSPDGPALAHYHGKALRLPEVSSAWPNPLHLAWHRTNRFQIR